MYWLNLRWWGSLLLLCENRKWKNNQFSIFDFAKHEEVFLPTLTEKCKLRLRMFLNFCISVALNYTDKIFTSDINTILQSSSTSGNCYLNLCIFNTSRLWALNYIPSYSICEILAGGTSNQSSNWQQLKSFWIILKIEENNTMTTQTYDWITNCTLGRSKD